MVLWIDGSIESNGSKEASPTTFSTPKKTSHGPTKSFSNSNSSNNDDPVTDDEQKRMFSLPTINIFMVFENMCHNIVIVLVYDFDMIRSATRFKR